MWDFNVSVHDKVQQAQRLHAVISHSTVIVKTFLDLLSGYSWVLNACYLCLQEGGVRGVGGAEGGGGAGGGGYVPRTTLCPGNGTRKRRAAGLGNTFFKNSSRIWQCHDTIDQSSARKK